MPEVETTFVQTVPSVTAALAVFGGGARLQTTAPLALFFSGSSLPIILPTRNAFQ